MKNLGIKEVKNFPQWLSSKDTIQTKVKVLSELVLEQFSFQPEGEHKPLKKFKQELWLDLLFEGQEQVGVRSWQPGQLEDGCSNLYEKHQTH